LDKVGGIRTTMRGHGFDSPAAIGAALEQRLQVESRRSVERWQFLSAG
jgi:hypothetical protein